ncbi:S-adenosyl-L-methionine-dependent methyltransferase [Whalleya microplaca]|nr:S-adenosyl-L-methionine-dependent methyltransferase [Whalleya microplaca]
MSSETTKGSTEPLKQDSNEHVQSESGPQWQDWTIESIKLPDFNPPGLEVDHEGAEIQIENPYVVNPIERDHNVKEADRPWHTYKSEKKYFLPNDNAELSRLDRQHIMWTHILDGDLYKAPVKDPKHVLDLGTGSGIWATEFAKSHPNAQVLGVDLSKPMPPDVPPNCRFEELDFTDPWPYEQKFDLIHARLIFVAQSDPFKLLKAAYDALAPGGYLEHHELYGVPLSPDTSFTGTYLERFFFNTVVASARLGNDMLAVPRYRTWMERDLGFEAVAELHRALPLNAWPGGKYKAVGAMQRTNLEAGIPGIYTRMLMRGLGWGAEETAEAVQRAVKEVGDPAVHAYFPVFVVYGRKPLDAA